MDADPKYQQRFLNHCRILQILTRGEIQLHKIFRERWNSYFKLNNKVNQWNDDGASRKELLLLCTSAPTTIKVSLQNKNVDSWDVTSANLAIQIVSKEIKRFGGQTDKNEDKMINALREFRNEITHGPKEFSDSEYETHWTRLQDILAKLGDDVADIKQLKKDLKDLGQTKVIEIKTSNRKSDFIKLKEKGNKFFKKEKYMDAITIYDQILKLPKLSPENQALIFSNRSAAYLQLNDETYMKMAKRDAECAIQLWPCWWKGYFRMGHVEAKSAELQEAIISFEKALALNPKSKEIFDELSAVRRQHGIISREEHFIPAFQPKSYEVARKEFSGRFGISHLDMEKVLEYASKGSGGDILKAHRFRDGDGVSPDYTKAAAYYAKAAHAGNPEGMYNLALLYESGKGVKRDFNESLRWFLKAAEGKAEFLEGSGIPEAQHTLGLKYMEGIGVEKNLKTAVEWYEKAIKNGSAASANNLGILYKRGHGVVRSLKTAFQYFKISSNRGDTTAMMNLAHCYFAAEGTDSVVPTKENIVEGIKWLRIAAGNGDLVAARELEKWEKLNEEEAMQESFEAFFVTTKVDGGSKVDPLDEKQFRKEVEHAAEKGSFVAMRQLGIWKNMNIAMEAFKENNPSKLTSSLSKAIRLDHQIVEVPVIFYPMIEKRIQTHPNDIDAITCIVRINTKNYVIIRYYVNKYLKMYPLDEYLIEMRVACFFGDHDYVGGASATAKALEMYPQSLRFTYFHAIALCMQDQPTNECIKALDKFLALAEKDHDKVPACYYRKATYYMLKKQKDNFYASFKKGLEAEKDQLQCFLPYQFPNKETLLKVYIHGGVPGEWENIDKGPVKDEVSEIRQRKNILRDPMRKLMINENREFFVIISEDKTLNKIDTVPKPLNCPRPPKLTSLKPITLRDMDPTKDKVYDGYVLEANIIDYPFIMKSIATVIQDENGDLRKISRL